MSDMSGESKDLAAARKEVSDGFLELRWFFDDAPLTRAQRAFLDAWLIDQTIRVNDFAAKQRVADVQRTAARIQRADGTWADVINGSAAIERSPPSLSGTVALDLSDVSDEGEP